MQIHIVGIILDILTNYIIKIYADWHKINSCEPGIYADTPWDQHGVFSGNCIFNGTDPRPLCIYSNNPCDIGVCATSDDWVNWRKRACMTKAPSKASQTNHDTSIWQDSDTGHWYNPPFQSVSIVFMIVAQQFR